MTAEIFTVVKVPISQIEEWLRSKHDLPEKLDAFSIDGNSLILNFKEGESFTNQIEMSSSAPVSSNFNRKRRPHRKRNRMKTRGWLVIARITNSKGQRCSIYKPFVEALQGKQMSIEEQSKAVEGIIKSNRNKPTSESIQYFLENTLEYLKGVR